MIRTYSLNPAVDVSVDVEELVPVHKMRAARSIREPGGGGINVSAVLQRFGAEVECVVAAGGATGDEIVGHLQRCGIETVVLPVEGRTRESIHIEDLSTGLRYRIVMGGADLDMTAEQILERVDQRRQPEVVVISGSLPPGSSGEVYAQLARASTGFTIVDTSGAPLRAVLEAPVDVAKPSLRELQALLDKTIDDAASLRRACAACLERYPQLGALLVSLGGLGAALATRDAPVQLLVPPPVTVESAVGAGDSMVAGVAWALSRGEPLDVAARLGVACGTACVATMGTELCFPHEALPLLAEVTTTELGDDMSVRER